MTVAVAMRRIGGMPTDVTADRHGRLHGAIAAVSIGAAVTLLGLSADPDADDYTPRLASAGPSAPIDAGLAVPRPRRWPPGTSATSGTAQAPEVSS
jgi:hypothetical protein